jgi:hypothetical protein
MVENLMATPESEFNRKLERKRLDEDIDNYLGPLQDEKELETLINSPSPESKKKRKNSGPSSPYRKPEAAHTKQKVNDALEQYGALPNVLPPDEQP